MKITWLYDLLQSVNEVESYYKNKPSQENKNHPPNHPQLIRADL